jgi:hypothetical protein
MRCVRNDLENGTTRSLLESKKVMKYWLYLAAKLTGVLGFVCGLHALRVGIYLRLGRIPNYSPLVTLYTFLSLGIFLIAAGLIYLSVWDQKRRCRACLRRLIMPVSTGSWGHIVLFGQPRVEWICPYGHGTLSIAELQIAGRELPDWQPHDDNIWKELESYHQVPR